VNDEYFRTFTKKDGTVVTQITGRLTNQFTTEDASVTVNISGPGTISEYPNGDVEVASKGLAGGPPPHPRLARPHLDRRLVGHHLPP